MTFPYCSRQAFPQDGRTCCTRHSHRNDSKDDSRVVVEAERGTMQRCAIHLPHPNEPQIIQPSVFDKALFQLQRYGRV